MKIRRFFKALLILLGVALLLTLVLNSYLYYLSDHAGPFDTRWDGKLWNPPQCVFDEQRVGFEFAPTEVLWEQHVGLGTVAINPDGNPVIILDNTHFQRMPPVLQRFIVLHECAHLKLGHLGWSGLGIKAEKDADCYAMNWAKSEGWTQERFESLYAATTNQELMWPAFAGIVYSEELAGNHTWTPEQRVDHARSCLKF